jgi:3-methyladenine DNA glycosylase AlkD
MAPTKSPARKPARKSGKAPHARLTLAEAMRALEKAGTAQARKTYVRHGAREPLFGVSFAFLKDMTKRIGVDHDLALALWETGNFDAQNLALKVADPARMTPAVLDRWARGLQARMCGAYVASLTVEGPHASAKADQWLASKEESERCAGWGVVSMMASRDEAKPDAWFGDLLGRIEKSIHRAPNSERAAMNQAVIAIGGRSAALRRAALAAAKRIGTVEVDHGDTSCETPDAGAYIEKMWAHAKAKSFESPAAQERNRESPRLRC